MSGKTAVFRYPAPAPGETAQIDMPHRAEFLTLAPSGDGTPSLYFRVDPMAPMVRRYFVVTGTGHPVPDSAGRYFGIFTTCEGSLVWHCFEVHP